MKYAAILLFLLLTSINVVYSADVKPAKPVPIPGEEMLSAYEANEIKAEKSYKGKSYEITGFVFSIKKFDPRLGKNGIYVTITKRAGMNVMDDNKTGTWDCTITDQATIDKVSELNKGDAISLIGEFERKSIFLEFKDCKTKE